jgi:hypothetical protein
MIDSNHILTLFESEFSFVKDRFKVIDLNVSELKSSVEECIYHPGVYVFYSAEKIIKVGRHLVNSRKRALEHIRDNTMNENLEMKDLAIDPNVRVLLINVKNLADAHWVASVEIFLETCLTPLIRSKRLG